MAKPRILVVDDEKNIRLTVTQALAAMGYEPGAAVSGEDALEQLAEHEFGLILLDLKMPGIDGLEVLRQVVKMRPDIKVVIISAHGTIENAVEAMKLGAIDFIQKPFTPQELREIVAQVLDRSKVEAAQASDYDSHLALTKRCMSERHFEAAMAHARQAIGIDSSRPEAFNLLGALYEVTGDPVEATKNYRVALDLDPTYEPAWENLRRPQKLLRDQTRINLG
jgi:DNA-binding NtrC family response regulator